MTSDDVIHSWWVPAFAVKQDANPGFINEAWTNVPEPGIYRGQCAELCGKDHGFMPIVVEVKSEADYAAWIDEQAAMKMAAAQAEKAALNSTASMDELMELGLTTYATYCSACHQAEGQGLPPVFPALAGSPMATTGSIDSHIDIVVNGKPGTAMQSYVKQLSLKEIAAVVTYERNAWGNNTGEMVQASDVKAYIEKGSSASNQAKTTIDVAVEEVNVSGEEVKASVEDVEAQVQPQLKAASEN